MSMEPDLFESGGTTALFNAGEIVDAVYEIANTRDRIVREPSEGLGEYAYTTKERFMNRRGRGNLLDEFITFLTARATTSGSDIDSIVQSGAMTTSLLPVRGRPILYRHITSFRYSIPIKLLNNPEMRTAFSLDNDFFERRQQTVSFEWKKVEKFLRTLLASPTTASELKTRIEFLLDPTNRRNVRTMNVAKELWGGSLQIPDYKPEFARADEEFDFERAEELGEAMWVPDWLLPMKYVHGYTTAFMSPSKNFLNWYVKEYFDNHPQTVYLKQLAEMTKSGNEHTLGKGVLRHYSYEELCDFPGDTVAVTEQKKQNRQWWAKRWELFWHLDQARKYAFDRWSEDLKNAVLEYRRYQQAGFGERDYLGFFVQMPPTYQYSHWQQNESRIQETEQGDVIYDGQTLAERNRAMEKVVQTLRWSEILPRVWDDGSIHFRWWANPDHEKAMGGHCQGCSHTGEWLPAEMYGRQIRPANTYRYKHHFDKASGLMVEGADSGDDVEPYTYPHTENWYDAETYGPAYDRSKRWVYQESQTWYPSRQELQLLRKVLYTHNAGSGFYDIFVYDKVSDGDTKTLRNNYFFSGNEAAAGKDFWWPGAPVSSTVRETVADVDAYIAANPGLVAREWWLGPFAGLYKTGESNPFNSYGLDNWDVSLPVQDSWNKLHDLMNQNWNRAGIKRDDVHKVLPDINDFVDGLVFPTHYTTKNIGAAGGSYTGYTWKSVGVSFDPFQGVGFERYTNMAFHLDQQWFNRRHLFNPATLRRHIAAYEHAFSNYVDFQTKQFKGDKKFVLTWPNGTQSEVTSFQDDTFKLYLMANWLHHHTLVDDLFENQDLQKVMETVLRKVNYAKSHGQAELRKIVTDETKGLPKTMVPFTRKLLEMADLRLIKVAAFLAEGRGGNRGLTFGQVTGWYTSGFGQGYTTEEQGFKMADNMFYLALMCKYWDNIKGLVEQAAMDPSPNNLIAIRETLAKLVGSRGLNWPHAMKVAEMLPWGPKGMFETKVPAFPEASNEVEDRWKREAFGKLIFPWEEVESAEKILEAMAQGKLTSFPETPEGIWNWGVVIGS